MFIAFSCVCIFEGGHIRSHKLRGMLIRQNAPPLGVQLAPTRATLMASLALAEPPLLPRLQLLLPLPPPLLKIQLSPAAERKRRRPLEMVADPDGAVGPRSGVWPLRTRMMKR